MTVSTTLQNTGATSTGVVLVIFRDPDTPPNTDAVIERTTTSASVADPTGWTQIGTISNCDSAGSHFIDYLPASDDVYWYRAKHVSPGFEDSLYVFETSGSAQVIPDVDFTTKPWLLDQTPLQLVMVVSSSNANAWYVENEVNQAVLGGSGTPIITAFASGNVGTITAGTNPNSFIVNRPSGSDAQKLPSYVVFRSTLSGYVDGYDKIELTPLDTLDVDDFLQLVLQVSASDANYLGIRCSAVNPLNYPVHFRVSGSTNVGSITKDTDTTFTIARPATGIGSVTFQVTSSNINAVSDVDTVFVEQDQSIDPDQFLTLVLTVTASSLTSIGVSASCDTVVPIGFGIVTSSNVGTITSDALGKWTIERPTSGEGSVTFIVTSSNASYISDTDTIYVSKDPAPYLTVQAKATNVTENAVTASIDIYDSNNQDSNLTGITLLATSQSLKLFTASQAGAVVKTNGKDTYTFHITRPEYQEGTGRVSFTATKTGYTQDSDALDVPERVNDLARLRVSVLPISTTTSSVVVSVASFDQIPQAGQYINVSYATVGAITVSPTGSIAVSASEARQFTIVRPDFGSGTGRVNFTITASGRINDMDAIDIPEKTLNTTPSTAAVLNIGTVTSGSGSITIPYSFVTSSTAQQVKLYIQESSGSAPAIASVEFTGTEFYGSPLFRDDGRTQISIPVSIPGNYLLTTFVPIDGLNRRGSVFTNRYRALTASLAAPSAFVSQSNDGIGGTFVTNSVYMPASNLGDKIRTYLNGAIYGSDITRTAGANATQSIYHTGLDPITTYSWQYSAVNNNGAESPQTDFIVTTTTTAGTLATPIIFFSGWQSTGGGELIFVITNTGDYPGGTLFEGIIYDSLNNIIGTLSYDTEFTMKFAYSGPGSDTGTAIIRATRTGYTNSSYSTAVQWNNFGGNQF